MIWMKSSKLEFIEKQQNKRVICFGAGEYGKAAIQELGIEKRIIAFCDNNPRKWGRFLIYSDEYAYPIISISNMQDMIEEDVIVLVTNAEHYKEIMVQLDHIGALKNVPGFVFHEFKFDVRQYSREFIYDRLAEPANRWLSYFFRQKGMVHDKIRSLVEQKNYLGRIVGGGEVILPRIVFRITTCCTLNCTDCIQLIPQFAASGKCEHFKLEQILSDMRCFLNSIDECVCATVCGGEPLIYPYLDCLLEELVSSPKIVSVQFETNGTVLPSESVLKVCRNEKVIVRMSDYGDLLQMSEVLKCFEDHGIIPDIFSNMSWRDTGGTECIIKDDETVRREYLNCDCSVNAKGIVNGKLFNCNRAQMLWLLDSESIHYDYIELDKNDREQNRHHIMNMYLNERCEACNRCLSGSEHNKKLIPALQTGRKDIRRSAYTFTRRSM